MIDKTLIYLGGNPGKEMGLTVHLKTILRVLGNLCKCTPFASASKIRGA